MELSELVREILEAAVEADAATKAGENDYRVAGRHYGFKDGNLYCNKKLLGKVGLKTTIKFITGQSEWIQSMTLSQRGRPWMNMTTGLFQQQPDINEETRMVQDCWAWVGDFTRAQAKEFYDENNS